MYASVNCAVAETTLKFCVEKPMSRDARREMLGPFAESEYCENDRTLPAKGWNGPEKEKKPERKKDGKATYDAIRLKKSRLRKNSGVIVGLHGSRTRFITITSRKNYLLKKDFLYQVENLRKELSKRGFTLKYSGMLERQKRGAWHLHALAYLLEDDWDYRRMQAAAVGRGLNIDMRKLRKAERTSKKIADYMAKLDGVVEAAYIAKMETGEDWCYTLTSKGCDLPRKKRIYCPREAFEFMHGYGFAKKEFSAAGGRTFAYYLLESEAFGREIYDSC